MYMHVLRQNNKHVWCTFICKNICCGIRHSTFFGPKKKQHHNNYLPTFGFARAGKKGKINTKEANEKLTVESTKSLTVNSRKAHLKVMDLFAAIFFM